ncbi:MAG: Lrp/AsnC family transcriptional regulator [Rhodospirillales bacterium]|nr:Lrp/AsnC family transcriptional regulator [Rhodospirillales bacterium]
MQRHKLDRIDLVILKNLQDNGRITNVDLASRADISAPPCLRRVRALEQEGYIHGYHTSVDAAKLGYTEMFFALVGLSSQAQSVLQAFEQSVSQWDEVRECHMIRGGGDFLIKLVARDKAHRDDLTMRLTSSENVITVSTLETIRTEKSIPGVPILIDTLD